MGFVHRFFGFVLYLALCVAVPAQQDPPQWTSSANIVGGSLVRGSDGNFYRAIHNSLNQNPISDDHAYWELYYCRAPVVLNVANSGARFSSLTRAWDFVASAQIPSTSGVTIHIISGSGTFTESFSAPFVLDHECGQRISISGDVATHCVLTWPKNIGGFQITDGHRLGSLIDLTINGSDPTSAGTGVFLSGHSVLTEMRLKIENFGYGVSVNDNSHLDCASTSVSLISGIGFIATDRSYIFASNCSVNGGKKATVGYSADLGSTIDAQQSSATKLVSGGYTAHAGSTINALGATANSVTTGFIASVNSTIVADSSICTNNTNGFFALLSSTISANGASVSGNTTDFNPPANTLSSDGSIIAH